MLRKNKSDYEMFIREAEMLYIKALQCEEVNKYEDAKNYFDKASKVYLEASKVASSTKNKHIAIAYHKQCEKSFYNVIKAILKHNMIINKDKEK